MKSGLLLTVLGIAYGLAGSARADDWPRWRGPANTGHAPAGVRVPDSLPSALQPAWRVPAGEGFASPVVCGGRVFHLDGLGGKEVAHAIDAATGRVLWSIPFDDVFSDSQGSPGPRCAPTADGDRVYVQSCRGEFRCLDAATGTNRWRVNFVKDFNAVFDGEIGSAMGASRHGNTGVPLVDGDRILVNVGGTNGASVVCFDKLTGTVNWKSLSDTAGYGGPFIATLAGRRQAIVFTAVAVAGLDVATGAPLWRVPVQTGFGRHIVAPVVDGDLVLVSSHQAGLMAVRVTQAGDGCKAETAWVSKSAAMNCASPVLVGRHIYGLGPGRKLVCVDVRTGDLAWTQDRFTPEPLRKDHAGFLVLGDRILALADNGMLILFAADPAAYRPLAQLAVCGRNWSNPAYAGGRLYLRDEKELLCLPLLP